MNQTEEILKLSDAITGLAATLAQVIDERLKVILSAPGSTAVIRTQNPTPPTPASSLPPLTPSSLPRLAFTMRETAVILGLSYITVHRLIQRGLLKCSGAIRHKIIPRTEIERFLRETAE
jgi:hypothetical protein